MQGSLFGLGLMWFSKIIKSTLITAENYMASALQINSKDGDTAAILEELEEHFSVD
jgi:hypothetical protein